MGFHCLPINSCQILQHVSPQEFEQVGQSLKRPLKNFSVLSVQQLCDRTEYPGKIGVKIILQIPRQLHN
jgi:hypothetical protein